MRYAPGTMLWAGGDGFAVEATDAVASNDTKIDEKAIFKAI
jgi:hypothetical protein